MKKYRFFIHYRRSDKKMSIHFRGKCYTCDNVLCSLPCSTKRNKTQPHLVIEGYCESVIVDVDSKLGIIS